MIGSVSAKRMAAVAALCALTIVAGHISALALSTAVTVALAALALWEYEPF